MCEFDFSISLYENWFKEINWNNINDTKQVVFAECMRFYDPQNIPRSRQSGSFCECCNGGGDLTLNNYSFIANAYIIDNSYLPSDTVQGGGYCYLQA